MAKCFELDSESARAILNDLTAEADSYMSINKYALLAVCEVLQHGNADREVNQLRHLISDLGFLGYDYARSPLRHLETAFKRFDRAMSERLAPVFIALRNWSSRQSLRVPSRSDRHEVK